MIVCANRIIPKMIDCNIQHKIYRLLMAGSQLHLHISRTEKEVKGERERNCQSNLIEEQDNNAKTNPVQASIQTSDDDG